MFKDNSWAARRIAGPGGESKGRPIQGTYVDAADGKVKPLPPDAFSVQNLRKAPVELNENAALYPCTGAIQAADAPTPGTQYTPEQCTRTTTTTTTATEGGACAQAAGWTIGACGADPVRCAAAGKIVVLCPWTGEQVDR